MTLRLQRRCFRFALLQPLRTAAGELQERCGWLLRLEDDQGAVGWGDVAPLQQQQFMACEHALAALPEILSQAQLGARLPELPGALGFGLGAALAELQGLVGAASPQGWLKAPAPALLLPAGEAMLLALEVAAASMCGLESCTLKWKVATAPDALERQLLDQLLQHRRPQPSCRIVFF